MRARFSFRLAALPLVTVLACSGSPAQSFEGRWDATVVVDGVEIPFRFEIARTAAGVTGAFLNGDERVESTGGRIDDDALTFAFDHYATRLEARSADGRLEGRYDRGPRGAYPFRAEPTAPVPGESSDVPSIGGLWQIAVQSSKGESAWRFIVRQSGPEISAAILRVDGDTGTLTGRYRDGRFTISHFSGARPLLLELTPAADGTLDIVRNRKDRLVAVREEVAVARSLPRPTDPSRHSTVRDADEPFHFRFPDATGTIVSSTDALFRHKVIVVSITGTWCPNCHDEAPFLTEPYRRYRGLGLEVVALSFEEAAQLKDPTRLRAYVARYGIEYPILLAGLPEELNEKVPQIANLNAFPTTIFLGRDGRVRDVHAGFPSAASGRYHEDAKEGIRALVERLLTEPVPGETQSS